MQAKKIITGFALLFFCGVIFLLLVFINLPGIVKIQAKKQLPGLINADPVEFDIERIGFSHFYMSHIRLAGGISADSMDVEYDIRGLSGVKLKSIRLSGLTVRARLDQDNQVHIQGLEFGRSGQGSRQSVNPGFLPEKIVINGGKLMMEAFGENFSIPFDVLAALDSRDGNCDVLIHMTPYGQQVSTRLGYQLNKGIQFIDVDGRSIDLALVNRFISRKTGSIVFQGTTDFKIQSLSPLKEWALSASGVSLIKPTDIALDQVAATVKTDNKKIDVQGQFDFVHPMSGTLPIRFSAGIDLNRDIDFKAHLETKKIQTLNITHSSGRLVVKSPGFSADLSGTSQKCRADLVFGFESGQFKPAESGNSGADFSTGTILVSKTKINSQITAGLSAPEPKFDAVFKSMINGLHAHFDAGDVKFAQCSGSGRMRLNKASQPIGNFSVHASGGNLTSSQYTVKASGISFDLPFSFPEANRKVSGTYAIPVILVRDQYQGGISGNLVQAGPKQFKITGTAGFKPLPGFLGAYTATVGFEKELGAVLDFTVNPFKVTQKEVKPLIDPKLLGGAVFSAVAGVKGTAVVQGGKVDTRLEMTLIDGQIQLPDSHLNITGIHSTVEMADLLNFRSMPGQTMFIDSIEVNDVKINDAALRFSIEDQHSFLVENLQFRWCNGLVSSESVRFPQKNNQYQLTLYCDRLELSQLLGQLGAFQSKGDGTLNGRIPVVYSNGDISFNNGFLFSTPGSGGRVSIKNTEKLTAGIPLDTPQFSQLDLAREALKDFDYTWAKLKLNTVGNTLAVAMELDGKPTTTLPFKFQKETGSFVRVDTSHPGSNFQGIKLDVNLNLPFNEVMKFGNNIKSLFK